MQVIQTKSRTGHPVIEVTLSVTNVEDLLDEWHSFQEGLVNHPPWLVKNQDDVTLRVKVESDDLHYAGRDDRYIPMIR